MKDPEPILVSHLFPELHDGLLSLLKSLSPERWETPTVCPGWSVKDIAAHLFGGDVGILSRKRDNYRPLDESISNWPSLAAFINALNAEWVGAMRRVSPRLLCDLLGETGPAAAAYFGSLDLHAIGEPVSWAGPQPAPVWLDVAREYTERWHHQQQIRDAVDLPGFKHPRYMKPVLDAFVHALAHTYREVSPGEGCAVVLEFTGPSAAGWSLLRTRGAWKLFSGIAAKPAARVVMSDDLAWRLFTRGVDPGTAASQTVVEGDRALGLHALNTLSIIA
jgi:uncharacterized protein (TIGR03083 family)